MSDAGPSRPIKRQRASSSPGSSSSPGARRIKQEESTVPPPLASPAEEPDDESFEVQISPLWKTAMGYVSVFLGQTPGHIEESYEEFVLDTRDIEPHQRDHAPYISGEIIFANARAPAGANPKHPLLVYEPDQPSTPRCLEFFHNGAWQYVTNTSIKHVLGNGAKSCQLWLPAKFGSEINPCCDKWIDCLDPTMPMNPFERNSFLSELAKDTEGNEDVMSFRDQNKLLKAAYCQLMEKVKASRETLIRRRSASGGHRG